MSDKSKGTVRKRVGKLISEQGFQPGMELHEGDMDLYTALRMIRVNLISTIDVLDDLMDTQDLEAAEELPEGPEDVSGNELQVGDRVEFNISSPDLYELFKGTVMLDEVKYFIKSDDGLNFIIDSELLNLHKMEEIVPDTGRFKKTSKLSEITEDMAFGYAAEDIPGGGAGVVNQGPMGYTDKSIWVCSRCNTFITNLERKHLSNGRCDECEYPLEQYEKVSWRP